MFANERASTMCIHYIEAEIAIDQTSEICKQVEEALAKQGEPLRWAIVEAPVDQPVRVEAVVVSP
jgi:chaperone required for assembly of F1-ATPase